MMKRRPLLAAAAALCMPGLARSQAAPLPKITVGVPHVTGAAPLVLAGQEGLFRKYGVEVELRVLPRGEAGAAVAAGTVDGAVARLDMMVGWAASGQPLRQILLLDRGHGDVGLVAAEPGAPGGLKAKRVACDGPGSAEFFFLGYVLQKAGLALADVTVVRLAPEEALAALLAGQCDAAVVAGPGLAAFRAAKPGVRPVATTLDFPVVVNTLAFPDWYVAAQAVNLRGLVAGWFDALALIAGDPDRAYAAMGGWTGQDGAAFRAASELVEWPPRVKSRAIMANDMPGLLRDTAAVLTGAGLAEKAPDLSRLLDLQFLAA